MAVEYPIGDEYYRKEYEKFNRVEKHSTTEEIWFLANITVSVCFKACVGST